MKQKQNLVFKVAKAIIANCETESQLQDVIFFLKSSQNFDKVVMALKAFMNQEQSPKVGDVRQDKAAAKSEKISALAVKFRKEKLSAKDVELLIKKVFQREIPSNKVGIEKYLQKLSREAIFEQIYNYFMSEGNHKLTSEDPWLKEMLNEQEKRDNVHE